jgi:hypothetical protein
MQQQADCPDNFCQPGRPGTSGEIFHAIIIALIPIKGREKWLVPEPTEAGSSGVSERQTFAAL